MQCDAIWLFDSQCVLCSQGVQYTLRHEKAASIRFVAIQSDEGHALARYHDVDPGDPATFLFIEGGVALDKSDAMIALARHLKGPAQIARLFAFIPKSLRDRAYGLIARNRYKLFGQVECCIVPRADQRHRFVL